MSAAEVVIELKQSALGSIALELALLLAGLAEAVRLQFDAGPSATLTLVEADRVSKAAVTRAPDGSLSFALGKNQMEYLHAVVLRAYRDHVAEVNHVHIEGDCEGAPFDLTVMFETFREPMSPEEATKLLGD